MLPLEFVWGLAHSVVSVGARGVGSVLCLIGIGPVVLIVECSLLVGRWIVPGSHFFVFWWLII